MSYEITAIGDEAIAAAKAATPTNPEENGSVPAEEVQEQQHQEQQQQAEEVAGEEGKKAEESEADAEEAEPAYFFGGEEVSVSIPDDIQSALDEKGIDAKALVAELFAKDGSFSVGEETRAKLDEAFGKPLVDAYLNLYKGQNDLALKGLQAAAESEKQEIISNTESFNELVGGDEGWAKLSTWAADNLSEEELSSYNAAMALPKEHWGVQRLVLDALQQRYTAAIKADESDVIRLQSDGGAPANPVIEGLPSTLTRPQFQQMMRDTRYKTDPKFAAAIDGIRTASAAKGI